MDGSTDMGRAVDAGRGVDWLTAGFDSFKKAPGEWIVIALILMIFGALTQFMPIIGPLAMSLAIPAFVGGLMMGCKEQHEGGALRIDHLVSGFRSPHLSQLVLVGVATLVAGLAISVVVGIFIFASLHSLNVSDVSLMPVGFGTLLVVLMALACAALVSMAAWFAPALVVFKDMPAMEAMRASFFGCVKNAVPFLVYGLIALLILLVATIPLFLGFLVAIPMFVASAYFGYRDIFE
jgi:uncharacterized membrane protein